ncbi:uncharacterized protein KGF55_002399 [Candida pseudojiufengensis]|uniref:uncharacterized protein n=1 Tax=Candida pseudojiufengensis TaxID=497109 RepID=UPI002223F86A|nr:uncharacterized protein KGF55_002399 [Candida pseudojiufengensis]KAI5963519.1 hypothetical protein KGF55_002399 [Candida pseudojiufengensis]
MSNFFNIQGYETFESISNFQIFLKNMKIMEKEYILIYDEYLLDSMYDKLFGNPINESFILDETIFSKNHDRNDDTDRLELLNELENKNTIYEINQKIKNVIETSSFSTSSTPTDSISNLLLRSYTI